MPFVSSSSSSPVSPWRNSGLQRELVDGRVGFMKPECTIFTRNVFKWLRHPELLFPHLHHHLWVLASPAVISHNSVLTSLISLGCSVQLSSVAQSCLTLCDPVNRSTPGLPVHHQLPEFTQTHALQVGDAIQPSHPLSSPSPPAPNPSQHSSLLQWINSSHEVAEVLEFQLQHQSFQWTPRTDLL